ncbi:hypothetical protein JWJ88_10245 [Paracoccus methylovorus]|uniref:Uncharacterized protein n=2 Tax=Paracoccus TaxID=265 RepID=A0ABX7JHU4_9RHOB|nr:hypothetical protein [Paracoccus methylovorus]QRZ12958.1 hypothetical protein JWJ88_10245 [Paracoccus methylovorus]
MNLELHGCVGISAANALCDCGLVSPATFVKSRSDMGDFVFEAIEMELQATVEIGRISLAQATKHPFITEAFARMQIDQFATDERVVFDHGHLSQCSPKALETAFARSARSWRRGAAPNAQG